MISKVVSRQDNVGLTSWSIETECVVGRLAFAILILRCYGLVDCMRDSFELLHTTEVQSGLNPVLK